MAKLFPILTIALITTLVSCGGNKTVDGNNIPSDTTIAESEVDSLALALNQLDSLQSKGRLVHIDTWKIGNLKSIEVQSQKVMSEDESIVFITLRKDCGGEYYYSWEDAYIFQKELPSLYEAIKSIKSELERATDHNEKYAYTTKDNVVLYAENNGKGWSMKLSVDGHKSNSYITLTTAELDKFVELLQQANNKLYEIQ